MTRAVIYNFCSSGNASLRLTGPFHQIVCQAQVLQPEFHQPDLRYQQCQQTNQSRGLKNVASRNALDVGTIQDESTFFFVKNLPSISKMALSRIESTDLFRDRLGSIVELPQSVWPTVEYTILSSSCVFSDCLLEGCKSPRLKIHLNELPLGTPRMH